MNTEEPAKGMTATGPSPDDSSLRRERLPPRTRRPLRHLHAAKHHGGPQAAKRRTRRSIHRWAVSNRENSEQAVPLKATTMPSGLQPHGRAARPPCVERSTTCRQRPAGVTLRELDCGHFAAAPSPDHRRARDRAKPPLPQQFFVMTGHMVARISICSVLPGSDGTRKTVSLRSPPRPGCRRNSGRGPC